MNKNKTAKKHRRGPGRPRLPGSDAVELWPVPYEPQVWHVARPFRFARRLDGDPHRAGSTTRRQVTSRDQVEVLIITEGTYAARKAVRAKRVAALFLAAEAARNSAQLADLVYALDVFLPLFGDYAMGSIGEKEMRAVRLAIERRRLDNRGRLAENLDAATLAQTTLYGRMRQLARFVDFAIVEHFADGDSVGAQASKPATTMPERAIPHPDLLEPFREVGDVDQVIVYDLGCGHGATERHVIDLMWSDLDLVRGTLYLGPTWNEGETDNFGRHEVLTPRELNAFVRGRILRIKQDRLGDSRVFEHWATDHGVVGAINSMQFKRGLLLDPNLAEPIPPNSPVPRDRITPTKYVGEYDWRDFRYAAGRRVAQTTYDLRKVGEAVDLNHVGTIKRMFSPFIQAEPTDEFLAGTDPVFKAILEGSDNEKA